MRQDQEREWRSALLDLLNIAGVDEALKRFASDEGSCPTMDDLVNYKRQMAGEKAATEAASADAEKARWIALLARDKRALPKAAERGDATTVRSVCSKVPLPPSSQCIYIRCASHRLAADCFDCGQPRADQFGKPSPVLAALFRVAIL